MNVNIIKGGGYYPTSIYMLSAKSEEELKKKKIVLFGSGYIGHMVQTELARRNIQVYGYADNNGRLQGRKIGNCAIFSPYDLFPQKDVHFIICVTSQYINAIRLQLERNGILDYSICSAMVGFWWDDTKKYMNKLVDKAINIVASNYKVPLKQYEDQELPLGQIQYSLNSVHFWHPIAEWIMGSLKEDDNILELGPGAGMLSAMIRTANEEISISWLNYGHEDTWNNSQMFHCISGNGKKGKLMNGYLEDPNEQIEGVYSIIIMTEVMEHFLCNPVPALKKIGNALKKDGILYLSTPNWNHYLIYKSWKDMPMFENMDQYLKLGEGMGEHIYQYSKDEVFEIADEADFIVVKYEESVGGNHNVILKKRIL